MNWQALFILVAIVLSLATAIIEPLMPPTGGGVYMPSPSDGILPFQ
jgi:hypothetical protein